MFVVVIVFVLFLIAAVALKTYFDEHKKLINKNTESIKTIGEHHVTYHNQGLCHYSLGELVIALENFEHALSLNKDYEKARSWIEKVTKEIECKQKE